MSQKNEDALNEDERFKKEMAKMVNTYDDYMKKTTMGREKELREKTVGAAGVKAGHSVLEIGCATGSLAIAAAKAAGPTGKTCAIDVIPEMVEYSVNKAKKEGIQIDFREASIVAIPYEDNAFDVVLSSFMIFHMSDDTRNKGIKEIFRVLRPGGQYLVVDLALPQKTIPRFFAKVFFGGMLKHKLDDLVPMMKSVGFGKTSSGMIDFRVFGIDLVGFLKTEK